ncbi:MAG: NADPH:quinone oxidoreductase family protein [Alphaproteobacteria bacterium]|jgi:NADPH:quinone reductase|nr:NADPH:quinone oxidoreductase family protein [Alphaproteobacteria bacterium]MBT4017303.1 NADPH:quinone oxidoreductase family protein [Alphaproteobacteria bacterium]MBT4965592.1 NADPH:quinone oxidoreductase family protein [Alphaproteobacteria bacterium]MBT5161210.1 NADPH:quinone oxidoreductase family protein [Alphaproteobacteria bacterium]MBT5918105.1 NADPH:quinone oxidoreductase family protein [Alphaproteobacteria bacterium]
MRAVFSRRYGTPDNLEIGEFPKPVVGPGELLIAVKAAGVAFHDGLQLAGKHQIKHDMPYVPGMEIAGTVAALGEGVEGPKVGTPVISINEGGGWGEFALVKESQVWPIPADVDFKAAAALGMAYTTAHCGIHWEGQVTAGDTVLITGATGAVGLAAVECAKALGARVIAVASSEERLAIATEHGADEGINYITCSLKEAVKELTNGEGVNVAFDPVMGSLFPDVLSSLAWGARHVIIGFAGGEIPKIPSNRLLVKNRRALGMVMSYYRYRQPHLMQQTVDTLLDWYQSGKIHPRIAVDGPLEKAPEYLNLIMDRKLIGRAILV